MNLTHSDSVSIPSSPTELSEAFGNSVVDGVAVRTQWDKVNPAEATISHTYLNSAASLSTSSGKKFSLIVTAGVTTPEWVFNAGAYRFSVQEQTGVFEDMPLIWDAVFQAKWDAYLTILAAAYGNHPNLAYVVTGGMGRRAESFYVTDPGDQAALDAKAQVDGFIDGLDGWKRGAKWLIDTYCGLFTVPVVFDMGAPYPTVAGQAALQEVLDYGDAHYRGKFAVKSDGLGPNGPPNASIGVTEVAALTHRALVGYQFSLPAQTDTQNMINSLNRGISFGAHFIEVYKGDCEYAPHAAALTAASARMRAVSFGSVINLRWIEAPKEFPPPTVIKEPYGFGLNAAGNTTLHWVAFMHNDVPRPMGLVIHASVFKFGEPGPLGVCRDLYYAGYNAAAIEYRLADPGVEMHPPNGDQPITDHGLYPEQVDDTSAAVLAARNGTTPATTGRVTGVVFSVGGSSGGTHAAHLVADEWNGGDKLDACVSLSGCYYFDVPSVTRCGVNIRQGCANYVGTDDSTILDAASPWHRFTAASNPFLLFCTNNDHMTPSVEHDPMVAYLASVGAPYDQRKITEAPEKPPSTCTRHSFTFWNPEGTLTDSVSAETITWLLSKVPPP
jgi:hypothetical protein